jgi:subtilisin family serine protease
MIDEGIDVNHPDFRHNIWTNSGEVAGNKIDDVNGYDFANNDATVYDPDPISGMGDEHGTHVAGTIAAVGNNGIGITGVNWDPQVASLKFLSADGGYTSDAIEAVNYALAEGMDISNNSWGGGGRR